ncbi:MAG: pyridoxamine 5'-phosphate oxidase [Bacteroidia bacterium]
MMNNEEISKLRKNYSHSSLLESEVDLNPINQFQIWFAQAMEAQVNEPNAMCLSTSNNDIPDSRVVLLKGIEDGGFVFYTNYQSHKGQQIENNPNVHLNFLWLELERQVRIWGKAKKVSSAQSDAYFKSRPFESQLGAIVSTQSSVIESREVLDSSMLNALEKYNLEGQLPSRPEHWGGYIVEASKIEFWQGRPNRLHDRLRYELLEGNWEIKRLAP